jgi:hypothetical protein
MFRKGNKSKVFWVRLTTFLASCAFVIPAYVYFAPDESRDDTQHLSVLYGVSADTATTNGIFPVQPDRQITKTPLSSAGRQDLKAPGTSDESHDPLMNLLSGLLLDYRSTELTPDQKRQISRVIPEINQRPEGREMIVSFFFDEQDPELAATMYDILLDAKLKDPELLELLISRDEQVFNPQNKVRLIDLIADHNSIEQMHSQKIEDFLADMVLHADADVRQAAVAQWAWYVNRHKGILPVLNAYLFNHSSDVRAEIYEMIELDAVRSDVDKRELALALESLEYADYLSLSDQEKARLDSLKSRLSL